MSKLRVLVAYGTRPEAIKLAPVIRECRRRHEDLDTLVCSTGQHRDLLAPLTEYFELDPDFDLQLMHRDQAPAQLAARCLADFDSLIDRHRPDCVVVQGDTTTVAAVAMAAFYRQVPLVHVEAGLRTHDLGSPWPEEFNRRVASLAAALHCAPTDGTAKNLLAEGIPPQRVHVTGNPGVDALRWTVDREQGCRAAAESLPQSVGRRIVLVTAHRRENFGQGLERICQGIAQLAGRFSDVDFVWPVHPNPNVHGMVHAILEHRDNVQLLEAVAYPHFVWLMHASSLVLSDSGGVQEEAPALGKRVLVLRDSTERTEGIEAGAVELVGTRIERIVERASHWLCAPRPAQDAAWKDLYGDGHAAERIVDLVTRSLHELVDHEHVVVGHAE